MATMLLEPFARELIGSKEPNGHQLQFLYLPLPIFRKFTNVESIATDNYIKDHAKQPTKREIGEMIEECHRQMGQLNKWGRWKLSKLKFRLPNLDTGDAQIIDFEDERQMDEDRILSSHQNQFVYLPLSILESATNIRQLFGDIASGKMLDALIRKIHRQMPSKDWAPELDRLRFIDTSNDDRNANDQDNIEATVVKPMRRTTRLASMRVTAMERPTTRQLRKRKWQPNYVENSANLVSGNTHSKAKSVQSKKSKVISDDSSTESQPANEAMDNEHVHSDAANESAGNEEPSTSAKSSEILDHLYNEMTLIFPSQPADEQQYDESEQRDCQQKANGASQRSSSKSIGPNDFQKEIMAMDYETFVNETNAKELVRKHFQNKTEPMTDEAMETELKKLDEDRYHLRRYHKGLLNHLKILKCECQRHKTFQDKWTQTDVVQSQDANSQCDSVGGSTNELVEPIQDSQPPTFCQSKPNISTTVQNESISSTFFDTAMTTGTQAASPLNESPLPKANEFDSPCPRSIEIPNEDIESILDSMEMDDAAEEQRDRVVDEQAETVDDDSLSIVSDSEADEEEDFDDDEISNQSTGKVNYNPVRLNVSEYDVTMAQETDSQAKSEIMPQSKAVEYMVECGVVLENVSGQYDATQNSTAVDLLVNEANFIDSETPIDDENEHDSTQPAGISGATESNANEEITCHDIKSLVDVEMSISPNDNSNVQDKNSTTSSDKENDSRLSQFEPKEISTPKPMIEVKLEEQHQQAPCQKKNEKKRKSSEKRLNRPQNPLETIFMVKNFIDGVNNNDPGAIGRLREVMVKRSTE